MKIITESDNCVMIDQGATCFKALSEEEIELVKNSKTQVQFRKGENLTKQGAFASYILFIIDGLVKQHVESDATHTFNLKLMKAGEFVGLSTVFNQNTFNYSTIALRETLVFLIEKEAIVKLVRQNGEFAFNMIQKYCLQNAGLYQTIRTLIHKQMPGKLAEALLYLSSNEFSGEDVFRCLNRQDLADFAGISMESAVKLLKTFEKDQLISLEDKNIVISNRKALEEISRHG
jgi:CRP-like cAMP-binding protein